LLRKSVDPAGLGLRRALCSGTSRKQSNRRRTTGFMKRNDARRGPHELSYAMKGTRCGAYPKWTRIPRRVTSREESPACITKAQATRYDSCTSNSGSGYSNASASNNPCPSHTCPGYSHASTSNNPCPSHSRSRTSNSCAPVTPAPDARHFDRSSHHVQQSCLSFGMQVGVVVVVGRSLNTQVKMM